MGYTDTCFGGCWRPQGLLPPLVQPGRVQRTSHCPFHPSPDCRKPPTLSHLVAEAHWQACMGTWSRGTGAWWRASRVGERAGRRQGATAHQPASTSVRMVSGLLFLAAWRMLSGVKPRRCAAIFALRTGGGGARVRAAAGSRAAPGGELGGAHRRSTIPRVLRRVWPAPGAVWLHLPKRNVPNVRIRALKACARWITLGGSVWSHQNGRKVGARQ